LKKKIEKFFAMSKLFLYALSTVQAGEPMTVKKSDGAPYSRGAGLLSLSLLG
jgi:hypothetical protein